MSGKSCSFSKQNSTGKKLNPKGCTKSCDFGLSRKLELSSPLRFLKHLGGKVAALVVRIRCVAAPAAQAKSHHPKERAKTSVAPVDSHRAEAIHDCIDFINSSSSLPRSNSVAR